jgi:hypothetical protein
MTACGDLAFAVFEVAQAEDFSDVSHGDSRSKHEPVSVLLPGSLACLVKGGLLVPSLVRFSAQFV